MYTISLLILYVIHLTHCSANNTFHAADHPQPAKAKVWGPGLRAKDIVLPARYFYIQAIRADGSIFSKSIGKPYEVHLTGLSERHGSCRAHFNQIDRGDGSVIIRYKILDQCTNVEIHISVDGIPVAKSPYRMQSIVRSDNCNCPLELDYWLEMNGCPVSDQQIEDDLKPFYSVNFTMLRDKILKKYDSPGSVSLCNYVVKSNQIYRRCYGQYTGFKMFMDAVLVSLVRKVRLPDTEFFMNLGDWPLVKKGGHSRTTGPYPIFSWCGSDATFDIVLPTYDLTESSLETMGRVMLDMLSVQSSAFPWQVKENQVFWRGRDSRRERLNLIDVGRTEPELFNVSLTNFFFFRDEEVKYGPKSPRISFMEFFRVTQLILLAIYIINFNFAQYKYQINIDGTVASYRLPYLLAGDSLVLKQDSPFYEHFYKKLVPYEHYIPFKRDLSDLVSQVRWAIDHESEVRQIIRNAQRFTRDNLMADHVLCYHVLLLKV